jgi:site-specific recombinase
VIMLAAAVVVFGATRRLQAPVLSGAAVLAVQALSLLSPWFAVLSGAVPLWGWVAVVGLGLVVFGARYEARMQQLRGVRLRLAALD